MAYTQPTTTKAEITMEIGILNYLINGDRIDMSAINQQIGKLQSLAKHLPDDTKTTMGG